MFCPKCGAGNKRAGQFCRKCGTDLKVVSDALAGRSLGEKVVVASESKNNLESALGALFGGFAFLVISILLAVTGIAGGHFWWFWLLIPAFGGIGTGLGKFIQYRKDSNRNGLLKESREMGEYRAKRSLPVADTEFVSSEPVKRYETGEIVPASVVENTTRLLELDIESDPKGPSDS